MATAEDPESKYAPGDGGDGGEGADDAAPAPPSSGGDASGAAGATPETAATPATGTATPAPDTGTATPAAAPEDVPPPPDASPPWQPEEEPDDPFAFDGGAGTPGAPAVPVEERTFASSYCHCDYLTRFYTVADDEDERDVRKLTLHTSRAAVRQRMMNRQVERMRFDKLPEAQCCLSTMEVDRAILEMKEAMKLVEGYGDGARGLAYFEMGRLLLWADRVVSEGEKGGWTREALNDMEDGKYLLLLEIPGDAQGIGDDDRPPESPLAKAGGGLRQKPELRSVRFRPRTEAVGQTKSGFFGPIGGGKKKDGFFTKGTSAEGADEGDRDGVLTSPETQPSGLLNVKSFTKGASFRQKSPLSTALERENQEKRARSERATDRGKSEAAKSAPPGSERRGSAEEEEPRSPTAGRMLGDAERMMSGGNLRKVMSATAKSPKSPYIQSARLGLDQAAMSPARSPSAMSGRMQQQRLGFEAGALELGAGISQKARDMPNARSADLKDGQAQDVVSEASTPPTGEQRSLPDRSPTDMTGVTKGTRRGRRASLPDDDAGRPGSRRASQASETGSTDGGRALAEQNTAKAGLVKKAKSMRKRGSIIEANMPGRAEQDARRISVRGGRVGDLRSEDGGDQRSQATQENKEFLDAADAPEARGNWSMKRSDDDRFRYLHLKLCALLECLADTYWKEMEGQEIGSSLRKHYMLQAESCRKSLIDELGMIHGKMAKCIEPQWRCLADFYTQVYMFEDADKAYREATRIEQGGLVRGLSVLWQDKMDQAKMQDREERAAIRVQALFRAWLDRRMVKEMKKDNINLRKDPLAMRRVLPFCRSCGEKQGGKYCAGCGDRLVMR